MTKQSRIFGSGGGGGGGCFLGHTLVRVPGGQRRIDELQPGDLVLSFDHTGQIHEAKVLKVHEHEGERVNRYTLWGGQHLDATPNHWVLNQFNAFVEIDTLGSDDCLVDANGHLRPIVGKSEFCTGTVYNLTVEGHHTFIAGGIRVHNAGLGLGITGSGGGGGGGGKGGGGGGASYSPPTTADDTLASKAYARVLDLISEGEIEGLANGNQSIFFNGTPLINSSNNPNFQGYTVSTRSGTQNQTFIQGFPSVEEEYQVGETIEAQNTINGSWSRTWNSANQSASSNYTRSSNDITVDWTAHGMTAGDAVFLNFEEYNGPYDRLYTVTAVTTNTFTVERYNSSFTRTSGLVYAIRPWFKITASGSWTAGDRVYLVFGTGGSANGAYTILSTPAPSGTEFYVAYTDLAGARTSAVVSGGTARVTVGKYTKSGSTVTITKANHGYTSGMKTLLTFRTGSLAGVSELFDVVTATTNSFTVTRTAGANTGTGEYFVDVPVTAGAITRSITNVEVDRVRVTISVPSLQSIDGAGNIGGNSFRYALDVQLNGGGYSQYTQELVQGKASGGYNFAKEIDLSEVSGWNANTVANNFPVDIRVRRISNDSSGLRDSNAFSWLSYTELTDAKLRYPNSALIGLEIDAQQFNAIPSRMYDIKGIKIRIPSNATANTSTGRLTFAGAWDGTFSAATWCACPAWILWDLLTSRRYGFGEQILTDAEKAQIDAGTWDGNASRLDKWSFYAASQYANELVNTGLSNPTQEARFSCNVSIQNSEEAFDLVNKLLSVFRTQGYWAGGSVTLAQDRPQDASYVFGAPNVVGGNFTYQGSDIRTRPTVVAVRYLDRDTRDTAIEVVEDAALIDKYGIVKEEIEAFACTSRSQAARVGKWLLYTNQYETETVSFAIAMESGVVLRPGMIINISDPTRAGTRLSGRVNTATTTTVVIDADRTISAGDTLTVVLPNSLIETRTVSSYNSGTKTITVSTAFSVAPQANAPWLLTTNGVSPSTWRVISINEDSTEGSYGVTALSYNSGKYAYVESGTPLQQRDITALNEVPASPTNLTTSENLYVDSNLVFTRVSISWTRVERAVSYQVRYRVSSGNWVNLPNTQATAVDIPNAPEGNWQVEITAVSVSGRLSQPAQASFTVIGKTAIPADMAGLDISQIDQQTAELSWPQSVDLDVVVGGRIIVRHTPGTTNVEWQDTNDIIAAVAGSATSVQVPLLAGTYLIKAEDSYGNRSANPVSVQVTLPTPQSPLTVITFNEDTTSPPFQGNLTNMIYSVEQDALILDQAVFFDSLAVDGDFDALPSIDSVGGMVAQGEYDFGSTLDLGGTFDADIRARFVSRAFLPGDLWDDHEELIDTWPDIDGSTLDRVNATLYVRSTTNDPTINNPTYTEWSPLVNGTRQGRGFQFKVVATSTDTSQNILIDELGATVELQRRTEVGNNISSGAGAYAVTFTNAFYATPSIGVSGQNMATGDYFVLSSISRTGFTVTFRNSAGTAISRTFDYTAVGHGRQLP